MKLPQNSIIASGPVIIKEIDGQKKILLNKHKTTNEKPNPKWQFPGGEVEDFDATLEDTAKREVKEELGIDIKIIKPLSPMMVKREDGSITVLIHYLAEFEGEIKQGDEIAEWSWFAMDELPTDIQPNIKPLFEETLK